MRITLVTLGKFKSAECEALFARYLKLAGQFADVRHAALSTSAKKDGDAALAAFLSKAGPRAFVTLLDERGKRFTSRRFAAEVGRIRDASYEWVVAVGGDRGYGEEPRKRAKLLWSLSELTLAHELAAAVAAEQIFRALSILENHPYHRD